jgi:NAD-dependent deacetylase
MAKAFPLVEEADCLLVIGTSLQVYPAAQLAFVGRPGCPIHVVDPNADAMGVPHAHAWPYSASEGLARLDALWFGS